MALKIIGTTSGVEMDTTAGKAAMVTPYSSAGVEQGTNANPVKTLKSSGRGTFVGDYSVVSFRTLGLTSTPQNLFTLWNPVGSGKSLAIIRLVLEVDHTTLLATNLQVSLVVPTAQPSAGTALGVTKFDSSYPAQVALPLGSTASDGGVATAITATAGTPKIWSNFLQRPPTLAGWFTCDAQNLLPQIDGNGKPIIIAAGSGILVQTVSIATAGAHYLTKCWWEEYTP